MRDRESTVIISDTHLSHPAVRASRRVRAEHLRPLWQGARRLVVAGDLAELQMEPARVEAAREVDELRELCERDGVELVVLSGNHDAFVSDRRHLLMMGGRVLVTHGDVLHPAIAPWARGAGTMKQRTLEALERYRQPDEPPGSLDLPRRLEVAQNVANLQFAESEGKGGHGVAELLLRPDRVAAMAWYWKTQPELAASLLEAAAPSASVIVFGHSHRPGVWRRRGRVVINTGSFVLPFRPRVVRIDGDTLRVRRVRRESGGDCVPTGTPLFELTLDDATLPGNLDTRAA